MNEFTLNFYDTSSREDEGILMIHALSYSLWREKIEVESDE